MNTSKILYAEEKNREFINNFLAKMFARTSTVPDFVNSEEFKREKEESLKSFRDHLEQSLNKEQVMAEHDMLIKEYKDLKATENEQDDLLKEEERLKRLVEAEEAKAHAKEDKIKEKMSKLNAMRKELDETAKKTRASDAEKDEKEKEYEKQLASASWRENLPQLHQQMLQELENLEEAFYDLDYKQTEWREKINAINELLKDKFAHANETFTRIRTESMIELSDFVHINILDFNNKKPMIIKDYKDLIHKVRKDYNAKVCQLPQESSQEREAKNAITNRVSALRTKSANIDAELKKLDNQMKELKMKSEDALADAKLRVSQTRNTLVTMEREMNTRAEELSAEQQKLKAEKETQEKMFKQIDEQIDVSSNEFAQEYHEFLAYREQKEREFEDFKKAEIARVQELIKQIDERNEEKRTRLEATTGIEIKFDKK